jgi:hypothetical protein
MVEERQNCAPVRGPLMHAHVGMMLAPHGARSISEYDPSRKATQSQFGAGANGRPTGQRNWLDRSRRRRIFQT